MKITLSKSQWEEAGKKAGWIKEAQFKQKMMPVQTPYTEKEKRALNKLIGDAAEGDPGEQGEAVVLNNNQPKTHKEIADKQGLARPCSKHDLILVNEGLQCGNCLALTRDHGKTWEMPKGRIKWKDNLN